MCVRVCMSVCPAERKMLSVPWVSEKPSQWWAATAATSNPRYDPRRGQRHCPLEYYYVEGKKTPYFLYIVTIIELRKYTVGGIIIQKSPSRSLLLDKTHPFQKINSDNLPQFLMPAESCSLYKRFKKMGRGGGEKENNVQAGKVGGKKV